MNILISAHNGWFSVIVDGKTVFCSNVEAHAERELFRRVRKAVEALSDQDK